MSAIIEKYDAQFPEPVRISEEEYLAFEAASEATHEYELGSRVGDVGVER